jgi:hypothetical protein
MVRVGISCGDVCRLLEIMQRKQFLISLTSFLIYACAAEPEALNSDRIEQRFGNYGVEIIEQSRVLRRANLYSDDGAERICRTYAIVKFLDVDSARIAVPHRLVQDGGSIGATFRAAGWQIQKGTTYIGAVSTADLQHSVIELMRIRAPASIAVHVYRLTLISGQDSIHYATVLEAHHPDYMSRDDLLEIYSVEEGFSSAEANMPLLRELILKPNE